MFGHNQTLQYFCSKCNSPLEPATEEVDVARIMEACPYCGNSLAQTLEACWPEQKKELLPQLQTASVSALTFDLKPLDDFFLGLRAGDALCITGLEGNLVASRLCVRAILSKKRGGLESSVLFIDAGNNSDVYQCVNFARQYGLNIAKVLSDIVVSRAFTIHQLAGLLIHELYDAIRSLGQSWSSFPAFLPCLPKIRKWTERKQNGY